MTETMIDKARRLVEWRDTILNFEFIPHIPKHGRSITGSFDVGSGFAAECHLSLCGDEVREQDKAAIQAFSNLCGSGETTAPIIAQAYLDTQARLDEAVAAIRDMCDAAHALDSHASNHPDHMKSLAVSVGAEIATRAGKAFLAAIEQKGSE